MKILVASDCYVFQTGGVYRVVAALVEGLVKRGHDVKVLALSNTGESYKDGIDYFMGSFPAFYYPEQRLSNIRQHPLLDELILWKPDLIHLHTEGSIARMAKDIAKKTGTPLVMTAHTNYAQFIFGRFYDSLFVKILGKIWGDSTYRPCEAVVLPSEKARSFCQFVTLKKRLVVIPNGIDPERYQKTLSPEEKAALFRKYHLTDNGFTMVMVTRVSREKNIQEILNFFPSLLQVIPQAQLLIAGDGPELKKLTAWCEKNGLDGCIRFIGRIPPEDVYQIYGMGDLYVSASDFEVHSISYLEAMACGLPLLCRYDISLKGMLRIGRNGYIYRTKQEFLKYAVEILKNPALQETMHKNALITAKKFSNERFTDRTLAFYADVLSHYSIPQAHPSK